jgi:hypothetical protein
MEKKLYLRPGQAILYNNRRKKPEVHNMQINSMLPALLNILTGQAGQNKLDRSNSQPETGEAFRGLVENPQETAAPAAARGAAGSSHKTAAEPSPGTGLPDFLPLPLKSPLFTQSRFFIKSREQSSREGADNPCSIFINLRTEGMGSLWIYMAAGKESLAVSFYTESDSFTALINESLPVLLEELRKTGYPSVKAAGITRPGIKSCSDIVPGSTAPTYLLDLEV